MSRTGAAASTAVPTIPEDGLLWRWATDWRLSLSGLSNGILQLMHPGLGAGVAEHSDFFLEPWARITRSIGPIVASIRDDDTARAIRDLHRDIRGVDHRGRRYHALDVGTYWWAHITLYRAVEQAARRFAVGGLTEAEREAMYQEGRLWYRRYGVSERGLPTTRAEYTARFQQICAEELEMTPAAERAVEMALGGKVNGIPGPRVIAYPVELGFTPAARLTSIGGLPAVVRERFGIPWSTADDVQYRALIVAAREGSRFLPEGLRRFSMRRHAHRSRLTPGERPAGYRPVEAQRTSAASRTASAGH